MVTSGSSWGSKDHHEIYHCLAMLVQSRAEFLNVVNIALGSEMACISCLRYFCPSLLCWALVCLYPLGSRDIPIEKLCPCHTWEVALEKIFRDPGVFSHETKLYPCKLFPRSDLPFGFAMERSSDTAMSEPGPPVAEHFLLWDLPNKDHFTSIGT